MPSPATLHIVSDILYTLNRLYAYWSFLVNYTLYTCLWALGGIPPNVDARVDAKKGWHPGVFVAGCEGEVGLETVRLLAGKGYTVFAAVRSEEEGETLKKGLTSSKLKGSVHPVLVKSLKQAVDGIRRYGENKPGRRLVAVVCNVGISPVGPLESMTDEEINVRPHLTFPFLLPPYHSLCLAEHNLPQPADADYHRSHFPTPPHLDTRAKANNIPLLRRRIRSISGPGTVFRMRSSSGFPGKGNDNGAYAKERANDRRTDWMGEGVQSTAWGMKG
jgi:NAD(P)-dependent dehydrogenase (short-subunit alcohol dehydrogenase family)